MIRKSLPFRILFSSSIGTVLEWYDFSLFAFLTPLLASYFFPRTNKFTGILLTYAIFAIGFFVRPIGAMIFGHYGDRIGRKKTLIFSILLMAITTSLIGLLPTYSEAGMIAPILLVILRLCQGLSIGGESTGALLFTLESNSYQKRGCTSALIYTMSGIGMLAGSLAGTLVTAYAHYTWAWRVPFLLGIFTGILGYFVRMRTPESAQFQEVIKAGTIVKFPLFHGIQHHKGAALRIMGLYTLSAMITYLIFIFMPTYATTIVGLPAAQASFVSTLALACITFLLPVSGYLSDLFGPKIILFWSAMGFALLSYPLFAFIANGSLHDFILAESVFVFFAICFQGCVNISAIDSVPTDVRYSVVAVSYSIAFSLFGGTAPLAVTYLVHLTSNKAAPGFYLTCGAIVAIIASTTLLKTNRHCERERSNPGFIAP